MGPKQSSQQTEKNKLQVEHPMFSIAEQVQGNQDQTFIRIQLRLASKEVFDEWYTRAKSFPQNQSLMQALSAQYKSQGICGNSGVALIQYHHYPYLLSNEIKNRKQMSIRQFEQSEMWYLVYTILSAASVYHQQGVKAGDIRPENIFINEDGQVKVASIDSWPGQQSNYAKSFYEKEITYLSPEQIKDFQFGKVQQSSDKEISETFSIGLTLLDAAILSSSNELYTRNFKFNYEKLQKKLQTLKKTKYSELLRLTIEGMCEIDTQFRISAREIIQWLRPYENQIVNLTEFQAEDIPQRLKTVKERNQQNQKHQNITRNVVTQYGHIVPTFNPNQQQVSNMFVPTKPIISPTSNTNTFQQNYPVSIPQSSIYQPYSIGSSFTPTYTIPSYNPPVYVPQRTIETTSGYIGSFQPSTTFTNPGTSNMDIHKVTLSKIDQQLQRSRQMFPQ